EKLEYTAEAGPGDFIYVPPYVPHRVGKRAAAGAGDQLRRRNPGGEHPVEQPFALVDAERVGLAGGPERREPRAAVVQQGAAVAQETIRIGLEMAVERSQDRREDTLHGLASLPRHALWISSIHFTSSGGSAGWMSRFTTTGSWPLRTSTQESASSPLALISWCGTYG